jgi:pyridoxamine 5'-phosphate oxidase
MVLLKDFSDAGFSFFTNYGSRKGHELDENPQASILFYWDMTSRQVRIDGRVVKFSREQSTEYFEKRPFKSRIRCVSDFEI